tara:strand:- start:267 stop:650 length:384 start_codon:yes stop_codon:yes gene_type:complete
MPKKPDKYTYRVKALVKVVDGDTFDCDIDLGFSVVLAKQRIRLMGVDTWESRTRDKAEKAKGMLAKQFTRDMLEGAKEITLKSHGKGKYGRVLGEVYCDNKCLNEELKIEGHAYEYYGGKKKAFNED